jgi:hypothetical protein
MMHGVTFPRAKINAAPISLESGELAEEGLAERAALTWFCALAYTADSTITHSKSEM